MPSLSLPNKLRMFLLVISIFLLGLTLLIRLGDEAQLMTTFPTDYINDISAYMAQLYFLDVCGFEQPCSYWYNGFIAFQFTPPGWYFFAYPLYLLFGDVKVATYLAIVLSLVIGFLITWYGGKKLKLQPVERLFFFLFFVANANALRGFLRTGRPHELFAWMLFFGLFLSLLWYKDRKIDARFYAVSLLYAACILSYIAVGVFASLFLAGLFLLKRGKERWHVVAASALGIILTFFWTIPYLLNIKDSSLLATQQATWLLQWTPDLLLKQLAATIFPLFFLFLFYVSWKEHRSRRDLLFFSPALILAALYLFRLNTLLPVFRDIFPSPYFNLFLLLSGYLYITLSRDTTSSQRLTHLAVFVGVVVSCIISLFFTAYFASPTPEAEDLLTFVPQLSAVYLLSDLPPDVYSKAVLAYTTIYHNKTTSFGYYQHVKDAQYLADVGLALHAADTQDCALLTRQMQLLQTTEYLTYGSCDFLASCGLHLKAEYKGYCIYSLNDA